MLVVYIISMFNSFLYLFVFGYSLVISFFLRWCSKKKKETFHENNGTRKEDFAKSGMLKNLNILKSSM